MSTDKPELTVSPAVLAAGVMAFYEIAPNSAQISDKDLRKVVSHIYTTMKAEEEAFPNSSLSPEQIKKMFQETCEALNAANFSPGFLEKLPGIIAEAETRFNAATQSDLFSPGGDGG